ncbi:hypothetical protein [Frigoriflavimonas asaccharolytica]|uniref:Uncharacterized protein n=1 Tax=Frigoriflavimonas asaccharolytica TaxID=2735899 RepID=A0A8J8G6U8_9FLAO|nr:hypothetical protein [Frigoriflavimonas asaccharolytica]NRS91062.1 hypothetical protein [Frigoriflavimonas asaccharolytica]
MIQDKDFLIRQIQQFTALLSKLLLGKNEGKPEEIELVIETQLKDIFKTTFPDLLQLSLEEIVEKVEVFKPHQQPELYEMLGHLFYFKNKENFSEKLAKYSIYFYEIWIAKAQIYSIPVNARIAELKEKLT